MLSRKDRRQLLRATAFAALMAPCPGIGSAAWAQAEITAVQQSESPTAAAQTSAPPGGADASTAPSVTSGPIAAGPAGTTAEGGRADEIVVTGTSIRGVAPVGSSLVSVGRDFIASSPATTTAQIIQRIPQIQNLGVSESSRAQSGGSGNVTFSTGLNLRGLGPYSTLTLVDGHRVIGNGTTEDAPFSPNSIPTNALNRVEVIADGSSATYGSDAVAGVVNLILRRDIRGLELTGRQGFGDHYHTTLLGAAAGHKWQTGQLSLAYEYSRRSELNGKDRAFFRADLRSSGGGDYRTNTCATGTILQGDNSYAIPAGGVTQATAGRLVPGTQNLCDGVSNQSILPRQTQHALAGTFDQAIAPGIDFYADGYATWRKTAFSYLPFFAPIPVPTSNAFYVLPPGASPDDPQTVLFSGSDVGFREVARSRSFALTLQGGVRAALFNDVKLNAYVAHGLNRDYAPDRYVDFGTVLGALASSDPATALDPYAGGRTTAATVAGINESGGFIAQARGSRTQYSAKVDGSLLHLPGGDLKFAVGGEVLRRMFKSGNVIGAAPLPAIVLDRSTRTVTSVYGELLVPVFGDGNAMPLVQSLDIDLSGRYDHYSDVGGTTNPKVGVNWTPVDGLKLRGSYGTSFRAPALGSAVTEPFLYVQQYVDPSQASGTRTALALAGPSNLRPETARTFTTGFDWRPTGLPGARLSITYFDVVYRGQIANYISDLTILTKPDQFAGIINRNPDQALIQQLINAGRIYGTPPPAPYTLLIDGRSLNLGSTKARGLDFETGYRFDNRLGTFDLSVSGTLNTTWKIQYTPGAAYSDVLNTIFNPKRFRMLGSAGWSSGAWSANGFVNFTNGYRNDRASTGVQHVHAATTVDVDLSYTVGKGGSSFLHDLKLSVLVENLFNTKPPFVDIYQQGFITSAGFDSTSASALRRVVSVAVGKRF